MSLGHNCWFQSSQWNIWEITEILMNILASFFVQPLFCALNFFLAVFIKSLMKYLSNYVIFLESSLINSQNLLQKQLHFSFFSCKNRICHYKFKLDAWNNGWTKKRSQDICDFPNITLAGLESAIVAKRHLVLTDIYYNDAKKSKTFDKSKLESKIFFWIDFNPLW